MKYEKQKVCMMAGIGSEAELMQLTAYAKQGCHIAIMDRNKEAGMKLKKEIESQQGVSVFFFHGDCESEEDRDLFTGAICGLYGGADYIIGNFMYISSC